MFRKSPFFPEGYEKQEFFAMVKAQVAGGIAIFFCVLIAASCAEQDAKTSTPAQADGVVRNMRFVRHPLAHDLCIGYTYVEDGVGNATTGGPAMISVDCGKVAHLLGEGAPTPAIPQPAEAPR